MVVEVVEVVEVCLRLLLDDDDDEDGTGIPVLLPESPVDATTFGVTVADALLYE